MDEPLTTTVEVVKQIDPDLTSDFSDDTLQALIDNAKLIALGDRFPVSKEIDGEILPLRAMATRYMALHLASMQGGSGSGITEEKVDVIETHYADTSNLDWLQRSPWGQAYLRLYQLYGGGGVTRYAVIEH